MKLNPWRPILAAFVTAIATMTALGGESSTTAATPEQQAMVDRFRTDYTAGLLAGAPEAVVAHYAEDVRLMPEYHKTVLGRTDVVTYYRAFLNRFQVRRYEREPMEVMNLGERLVEFGRFKLNVTRKENGQERELAGKYMDLWGKVAGRWEIVTATWNYSAWPASTDELRFPEVPGVRIAMQPHVPVKGGVSFELAALNRLSERAIVEKDHEVWSQFFADDTILLPNHAPAVEGREAINAYLAEHVKHMPVFEKLDIRNDRIDDLGRFVIEYASHVAIWRNSSSSGVNTGKNIGIWRREPSGALKKVRQIGSYD